MTDLEKPKRKPRAKKKPPTQIAGVSGIDGHGAMGEVPTKPRIDWHRLGGLPAFEMFAAEQSGLNNFNDLHEWVLNRRATLSDSVLYEQYAEWHEQKGLWLNETPLGREIK